MEILIIADFCGGLDGKGNNRFIYLANMLSKEHKVEVLTSDFNHGKKVYFDNVSKEFPFKITMVHEGAYKKNVSLRRFYAHYIWAKNVKAYLKKRKKPDVIYAAVPPLLAANLAGKYCEKNHVRFIIDIQDLWPEAFKMVFRIPVISDIVFAPFTCLANGIYKRADAIIAVSDTYVDRALQVSKKCKKGTTVFLGTKLAIFDNNVRENPVRNLTGLKFVRTTTVKDRNSNPLIKSDDKVWLAYCGTLGASYDLNIVIDAMRVLNDERLVFIIMGDGERRKEFERNAEGLDCVFTGRLPYNQMCGLLAACDITVNPIRQGAAQSIINKHADYAASGLPVLNTQECEEYRNLVEDYHMGFNCDNKKPDDLADKLRILLNDKNLRTEMGHNARRCAEELFDRAESYKLIRAIIVGNE